MPGIKDLMKHFAKVLCNFVILFLVHTHYLMCFGVNLAIGEVSAVKWSVNSWFYMDVNYMAKIVTAIDMPRKVQIGY